MQDNLEFLQWTKRHWDQYFPGHDYDAIARRKASGAPTGTSSAAASSSRTSVGSGARKPASTTTARVTPRSGSASGVSAAALRQEVEAQKEAIAGLEKERDFYFSKLRDIELLLQTAVEENPELEKAEDGLIKEIQTILYSTEDGFEIPAEAEIVEGEANGGEEPETF
jgi:microtubule-associated protein, RP/EB family